MNTLLTQEGAHMLCIMGNKKWISSGPSVIFLLSAVKLCFLPFRKDIIPKNLLRSVEPGLSGVTVLPQKEILEIHVGSTPSAWSEEALPQQYLTFISYKQQGTKYVEQVRKRTWDIRNRVWNVNPGCAVESRCERGEDDIITSLDVTRPQRWNVP